MRRSLWGFCRKPNPPIQYQLASDRVAEQFPRGLLFLYHKEGPHNPFGLFEVLPSVLSGLFPYHKVTDAEIEMK
jgi:hypothetical protein